MNMSGRGSPVLVPPNTVASKVGSMCQRPSQSLLPGRHRYGRTAPQAFRSAEQVAEMYREGQLTFPKARGTGGEVGLTWWSAAPQLLWREGHPSVFAVHQVGCTSRRPPGCFQRLLCELLGVRLVRAAARTVHDEVALFSVTLQGTQQFGSPHHQRHWSRSMPSSEPCRVGRPARLQPMRTEVKDDAKAVRLFRQAAKMGAAEDPLSNALERCGKRESAPCARGRERAQDGNEHSFLPLIAW